MYSKFVKYQRKHNGTLHFKECKKYLCFRREKMQLIVDLFIKITLSLRQSVRPTVNNRVSPSVCPTYRESQHFI